MNAIPPEFAATEALRRAFEAGFTAALVGTKAPAAKAPKAPKPEKRRTTLGNAGLDSIARRAGLPQYRWPVSFPHAFNGILAAREAALTARGFVAHKADAEGYQPWAHGSEILWLGPFGAVYLDAAYGAQMPREERDALTEEGRVALLRRKAA